MISLLSSFIFAINNRYMKIFIIPVVVLIYIYLILNFSSLDLSVYQSQLDSGVFYQREFLFGFLQKISVSFFSESFYSLKFIQLFYFTILLYLVLKFKSKYSWVLFFLPVVFLGEFNSLRQGFAALFVLLGLVSSKKTHMYFSFLIAVFFHTSAFIVFPLYLAITKLNDRAIVKFIIIIISGCAFLYFSTELLSFLGKSDYLRNELFSDSRGGLLEKALYLFIIGFLLFSEKKYVEVQSLGVLFIVFSSSMLIIPATDMIFRLSYYLQCFAFCFLVIYPNSYKLRFALFVLLLNPSTYTLILSGDLH